MRQLIFCSTGENYNNSTMLLLEKLEEFGGIYAAVLDDGWTHPMIAKALFLDDQTIGNIYLWCLCEWYGCIGRCIRIKVIAHSQDNRGITHPPWRCQHSPPKRIGYILY